VLLERFSREENFKFPVPFGKKITYPIMNNESFTIPHYLKLKNIDVRSSGSDMEVAKMMVGMGLLGMKPISINGTNVSPMDLLIKILPPTPTPAEIKDLIKKGLLKDGFFEISIETIASNGKIKKYWMPFPSQKELIKRNINSTYIAYPTGICAAAFALEMHNIKKSGVFPPEGMPKINRANVLKNMKRLGLKINI
jgi:saccharopine dehydrogenase-like NADP-dependent oxidoreductase